MSRFLQNGESSQSKLALSNLGGIGAGNVRLYKAFFKRRIFTQTCCKETERATGPQESRVLLFSCLSALG